MENKFKGKVTSTQIRETVDLETGEVVSQTKNHTFLAEREPDYVKIYLQDIGRLNDLTSKQNEILMAFIGAMGYKGIIPAFKPIKEQLAMDLGVSLNTVNKAVQTFKDKGLFIPFKRGMYIADPMLFGRGRWSDIKDLRLIIEYNQDGSKKLTTNIPDNIQHRLF